MNRNLRRHDGWILLEVITGLLVMTLVTGALAQVWTAGIRSAGTVSAHLTEERHRTLAVHYATQEARAGTSAATIATRLRERFPELPISVSGEVLSIGGEELILEVTR
ncbi:MAG: hypothetical protein PF508_19940 [Spirochaeta sp.]|jgi:hypothetical protein|nr:hypothetical protein [Spirochaeta sp.]